MDDIAGLDLILSIVISGVGFAFFSYGRKMSRSPQMLGGLVLMVFPYFVSSALGMLIVGALLIGAIGLALKMGW